MTTFKLEFEATKGYTLYHLTNGYYRYFDWPCLWADDISCFVYEFTIPTVHGKHQYLEIRIPYRGSYGGTLQWSLVPDYDEFVKYTGEKFDETNGYMYKSVGQVSKYITRSTNVNDSKRISRGTIYFPKREYEHTSDKPDYTDPIVISGNILSPNVRYCLVVWGNPFGKEITCDRDVEALCSLHYLPGLVHLDTGSSFDMYHCYIDNGTSWDLMIPYIDNGSGWDMYT